MKPLHPILRPVAASRARRRPHERHLAPLLPLIGVLLLSATAGAISLPVDDDHDGINDALEQTLAERYAPLVYIEPEESNYPVNVDWFLARTRMQYHEDCFGLFGNDVDNDIGPNPVGNQLIAPLPNTVWEQNPSCGEDDTGCNHPPHHLIRTNASDPDGDYSLGPLTTGYSDQQTFVLNDVSDSDKAGSIDPRDWVTYFHAYPTAGGGIMIQYWHVFAYNEFGAEFDNHGGDWDTSIQVQLDDHLAPVLVWYSRHLDDHPGSHFTTDQVRFFDGTHPVVTIDGGGHAAFRSPEDWRTCNCRTGESLTGVLGTISWTADDPAVYDDPSALRTVQILCNPSPPYGCTTLLSSTSGGIVWKTWTAGGVTASGDLDIQIIAPSAHGGLINLGEYNPCTDTSCRGSTQASHLLAGQFHALNNQWWLSYEGRWGSIGEINSGPRGPVFQGFEGHCDDSQPSVYRAWYNEGADAPATGDGSFPWRVAPSTTATVGAPSYTASETTYVTTSTDITLTSTGSEIAAQSGPVTTYYRFYESGGTLSEFTTYGGPFGLRLGHVALPDGVYNVQYFSVDGLGNVETTHTLTLTLDNSAPVITINQPKATPYPHTASLTLYSVTGSDLASYTPKMDGATTLPDGHGLQSGPPAIQLLTEMTVGSHTFSISAVDKIGNTTTSSVVFTIVVTAQSIIDDVNRFAGAGKITTNEVKSLLSKLNSAAKARAKGNCPNAATIYTSFISEVQAQSGKSIAPAVAAILVGDAQYLIAHCP
jgi:hypothetical protein